jgi:hypothetical protein
MVRICRLIISPELKRIAWNGTHSNGRITDNKTRQARVRFMLIGFLQSNRDEYILV